MYSQGQSWASSLQFNRSGKVVGEVIEVPNDVQREETPAMG